MLPPGPFEAIFRSSLKVTAKVLVGAPAEDPPWVGSTVNTDKALFCLAETAVIQDSLVTHVIEDVSVYPQFGT